MMPTLEDIANLCRTLAAARDQLGREVAAAQAEIDKIKADHMAVITARSRDVADVYDALHDAVETSPGLFAKPKSQILYGIKVGYTKGRGKITWKDSDQVIALIRKHLPEQAELLITTKEAPVKSALNGLSAADLRRIGVTVVEAGDQVVIAPQDSDLDKLVAAILGDPATDEDEEAA